MSLFIYRHQTQRKEIEAERKRTEAIARQRECDIYICFRLRTRAPDSLLLFSSFRSIEIKLGNIHMETIHGQSNGGKRVVSFFIWVSARSKEHLMMSTRFLVRRTLNWNERLTVK